MNKARKLLILMSILLLCTVGPLLTISRAQEEVEPLVTFHVMTYQGEDVNLDIARVIREELAKIGINLEVDVVEMNALEGKCFGPNYNLLWDEGGWDSVIMTYYYTAGLPTVKLCWSAESIPPAGLNGQGYVSHIVEEYMKEAFQAPTIEEFRDLMIKFQEVITEDIPSIPIYRPTIPQLTKFEIEGFHQSVGTRNAWQWTVEGKTQDDDVTVKIADMYDTPALNVLFVDGGGPAWTRQMFEGLFDTSPMPDGTVGVIPELAESLELSEDGLSATVKLRRGVLWHDGEPFTAEDVKFTFDAVLDPETAAVQHGTLSAIVDSVEIVDDYTVIMNLKGKFGKSYLMEAFTSHGTAIVPEHVLGDIPHSELRSHDTNTVTPPPGTGGFKFVKWVKNQYMEYEAFDDYWRGRPLVDHLFAVVINDPMTALSALEAGEVDMLYINFATKLVSEIERLQGEGKVKLDVQESVLVTHFMFNLEHPFLNNLYVRKAIAHAIPYEHITTNIMAGQASIANTILPGPWSVTATETEIPHYEYNIEKAKSLLAKAGYVWPPPERVITEVPSSYYVLPLAGGVVAGLVVGAGVTYAATRRKPT